MTASEKNKAFYKGKRVFITGHTGFKGAWLTAILSSFGAEVRGFALPAARGSLFEKMKGEELCESFAGDICDLPRLKKAMSEFKPEIVIHLAAVATVNDCFLNPVDAYKTNVMGAVNLLQSVCECLSVKSLVVVTTDKVYENKGDGAVYKESDALGGNDPYSSSKTCIEYIVNAYKKSYLQTDKRFVGVSTVRASNVLGGGDHIESRLIPTVLRSFRDNTSVMLRHPDETRPWQSVLDALNGYLSVARLMFDEPKKFSSSWNIGPTKDGIRTVASIVETMRKYYNNSIKVEVHNDFSVAESKTLGLDITKSLNMLDWLPEMSCDELLFEVVDYFKKQLMGIPEREIAFGQVKKFYNL